MLPLVAVGALALLAIAALSRSGFGLSGSGAPPIPVKITGSSKRERLAGLLPPVRARFQELQQWAAGRLGVILIPGSTLRSPEEQAHQYATGHSAIKTVGFHGIGAAIDMYLVDEKGRLLSWRDHEPVLKKIVARAEEMGFRSLAYNTNGSRRIIRTKKGEVWDAGHIEWKNPQTVAMLSNARRAYA